MAKELKHIGRVVATNKKCIVAYRTLPGDAHSCLIVPTENLPDIYHDANINLVESSAGQESYEFAEALDDVRPTGDVAKKATKKPKNNKKAAKHVTSFAQVSVSIVATSTTVNGPD